MIARWLGLAGLVWLTGCAPSGAAPPAEPQPPPAAAAVTPTEAVVARTGDPSSDQLLATESEYQGWRYFQVYCARCHGEDALGAMDAADLTFSVSPEGAITRDSFLVVVREGSNNKEMKGFQPLLDDGQIVSIYSWVLARSEGRLVPGRPHRAPARR